MHSHGFINCLALEYHKTKQQTTTTKAVKIRNFVKKCVFVSYKNNHMNISKAFITCMVNKSLTLSATCILPLQSSDVLGVVDWTVTETIQKKYNFHVCCSQVEVWYFPEVVSLSCTRAFHIYIADL